MPEFCSYLKEVSVKCTPCVENKFGACHIKLGLQEYPPKDFALYDIITIVRHDTRLSVETDIEVKYKTQFPVRLLYDNGVQRRPPTAEFNQEFIRKGGDVKKYLEPRLPPGVRLVSLHQHYHPEVVGIPDTVAIHIHAHKLVEDLDEAKLVVQKLVETIRPREIEAAIR